MRRRALLSGSVATLAMLPETVRAQWVDCGGLVPAMVAGPCVPTADLDLTFMAPGVLDPRITFTRASTGTYFNSAGVMQSAAIDAPRWDYDPVTHALRGLLLEDQRTNVAFPSVPTTGWTVTTVTPVPASGIAPDGTNSFVKILNTSGTTFHGTGKLFTITAGQPHTVSVYAKAGEIRYLQIIYDDGATGGSWATFDLQTGTIATGLANGGASTSSGAFITAVGGGVYRCGFTATVSAAGTNGRVYLINSLTPNPGLYAPTYAGTVTDGLYLWGAQLEASTFPTSYIPTTSAAVTRSADVCRMTGAGFSSWFTSAAGSIVEEVSFPSVVSGMNTRLSEFSDGTTTNFLTLFPSFSGAYGLSSTIAGTPGTTLTPLGVTTAGQVMRLGYTYGANRTAVVNGGAVVSTPGGIAPLVNQLQFGNRPDGVRGGIIHVRSMKFWSRAFSDAELQAATT